MLKKTKLVLGFTLIMLLAMSTGLMAGTYSGGTGADADHAYLISNTDDLIELSTTSGDWSAYFKQTENIAFDANEQNVDWDGDGSANWDTEDQLGFSPIGNITIAFRGSYDGDGHIIDNLFINRPLSDYQGLFGYFHGHGSTTEIQGLGLTNVDITGNDYVGGLVGYNEYSTISKSYCIGDISGGIDVGGLIGHSYFNNTIINNCYSSGSVEGTNEVGGLVGYHRTNASITNSYSHSNVTRSSGTNNDFGGFCGFIHYSTVENCYSTGDVIYSSGGNPSDKGFIGRIGTGYTFNNNFFDSEASNQTYDNEDHSTVTTATAKTTAEMKNVSTFTSWDFDVDGVSAGHNGVWIMAGYPHLQMEWSATVSTLEEIQMVVLDVDATYTQSANIDASATSTWNYNGSTYDGFSPIGNSTTKFTGSLNGQSYNITNLFIDRDATDYIGLFGCLEGAQIDNINLVSVDITGNDFTGGFAGQILINSDINDCSVSGSVSGQEHTGGFVGDVYQAATIDNCSANVTTSGTSDVGGFAGRNYNNNNTDINKPHITNSFSSGNVTGSARNIGGFVGWNTGIISECYATGSTDGTSLTESRIGGFVGGIAYYESSTGKIDNCYSTGDVSTDGTNLGATHGIGGFVGTYYSGGEITKSYSTGSIPQVGSYYGGFCGRFPAGTSSNNFFDKTTAGVTTDPSGALGKTTSEMTTDALVYNYTTNIYLSAGWDFKGESTNGTDNIWNIGNSRNNGYPYLDWEYPSDHATLPVVLSSFTAQFIENTPTLYWTTQSETDNMGWFVYRGEENDFTSSEVISEFIEGHGTTTQQQSYLYEDDIENPEVGDTYYYWLESIDYGGIINHYDNVAILTIPDNHGSTNNLIPKPERFGLLQNEPNPVINSTRIAFNLTEIAKIDLTIYNLKGQIVKKLYSGNTSKHTVMWDGKDEQGTELNNGVYLYRLLVNGKTAETKKLILMK